MAWNETTKILTAPFTKIAANGQGDLQKALRTTVMSEIQLVGDVDDQEADANRVHIASKFKPFKHSTVVFSGSGAGSDREASLQALNLGYTIPSSSYRTLADVFAAALQSGVDAILWQWDKPVPGTNPLRALDFDGYDAGCDWPYQLGITPSPAYLNARLSNSIRVSDADAGAGTASWDYTDLKKPLSVPGGSTLKISEAFGTSVWLAVAWAPVGQPLPTGAYTLKGSSYIITSPVAESEYNVMAFFTDIEYTGSPTSTTGIHIPVPKALSRWVYHDYLPLADNGSYVSGLSVVVKMRCIQSISYTSLGVQFYKNGTWSDTQSIYSSAGTISGGSTIQSTVICPAGYTDPLYFRLVWNGNNDTRNWTPQSQPTD